MKQITDQCLEEIVMAANTLICIDGKLDPRQATADDIRRQVKSVQAQNILATIEFIRQIEPVEH